MFFLNKTNLHFFSINTFIIVCFFFLFSFVLIYLIFFLSFLFGTRFKLFNLDSILLYECGFTSFNLKRELFTIQFYLVGLIFLIFDLEVTFLLPWIFVLINFNFFTIYYNGLIFLFFISIGIIYEYKYQILIW